LLNDQSGSVLGDSTVFSWAGCHNYREEEHAYDSEEDACGREQDHWNANGDEANQVHSDSRSPMLDTIDKLTEPTACSLLDGTGINVELALAKIFPFQKACHSVPV
jgi:hypothetical protein